MTRNATLLLTGLSLALWASSAGAVDQVKLADDVVTGTVQSVSPSKVVVEKRDGSIEEVPAGQIESISFEDEPAVLKTARVNVGAGRYEDALESLSELNTAEINRREIVQDVEFYRVYSAAQLALVGNGDIPEAGSKVFAFLNANQDSYHYLDAQMLFGDLAGAAGKPQVAQNAYKKVGQMASSPEYKARAAVALGRSYLDTGQVAEAASSFRAALGLPDTAPGIQPYKLAATLGEARCLAENGKPKEAITMIEEVIKQADSENTRLLAEAYNALGASYRANDQPKDALLAYLHTDLVYFNSPQNHIDALQNLVELWDELEMPERSTEAARTLRDRYNRSPR